MKKYYLDIRSANGRFARTVSMEAPSLEGAIDLIKATPLFSKGDQVVEHERSPREVVEEKEGLLEEKYPIDAMYCSKCSLWGDGLRAGLVTDEEYKLAQKYYGRLWNYVGD